MARTIKISTEMVDIVNQRYSTNKEDVDDLMDRLETISDVLSDHVEMHGLFGRFYYTGRYDGIIEMAFGEDTEEFRDFIYKELPELKDQILLLGKDYFEDEGNINCDTEEESLLWYLAELSYDFDSKVINFSTRDNIAYRVIRRNFNFIHMDGVDEAQLRKVVLSSGVFTPAGISLEGRDFLPVFKVSSRSIKKKDGTLFVKFSGEALGKKISDFLENGKKDPEDIIQEEIMKGFGQIVKEELLKPFLKEEISKRTKALATREARKEHEKKEKEKKEAKKKELIEKNSDEIAAAIALQKELYEKIKRLSSLGLNVTPDSLENL